SWLAMPLRLMPEAVVCVVVESALLWVLRAPKAQEAADRLHGNVVRVHVTDAGLALDLTFEDLKVRVRPAGGGAPHAEVEGDLLSYARLLIGDDPDELVMRRRLRLRGEGEAMVPLKALLAQAQAHWEEALAAAFGPWFARRVREAARGLVGGVEALEARARKAIADAAVAVGAVPRREFEPWQAGVEQLVRELARLEARIAALEPPKSA
ncbi:MAG: hypothetical protein D6771_07105, partial [Zetaproteobacteria bacterium]